MGTWARAPLAFERFFFARLYVETSCLVWYYAKLSSNSTLFVQRYSLLNDAIAGYNGACSKVVNAAQRYALARSLLSAGVRPSVCRVRVLYCIQTAEEIIKHLSLPVAP